MARKRTVSSTGFYHVMSRGNNREEILKKNPDKLKLLKAIGEGNINPEIQICAYCIMNNHYHILIRAQNLKELGNVMQRINSYYAHYYKVKYGHQGHVFQDRFLSKPLNSKNYIANVIRYIHFNPVKAGIAAQVKDYKFSSYREYGGRVSNEIIKDGGKEIFEILGIKDNKEFRRYHEEKEEVNEEAKGEIFFEIEEYRYEELERVKKTEHLMAIEMRNEKKNYKNLSIREKREFAKLIVNSTITLSNREISKIAMVGRKKLAESAPPGPS
ncbi:MAG TPA: transposase [Anaerovoracaceae bacterium]|nr:transposase [Anaerovoracaceae bacterium]